jgi:hypothetical protein
MKNKKRVLMFVIVIMSIMGSVRPVFAQTQQTDSAEVIKPALLSQTDLNHMDIKKIQEAGTRFCASNDIEFDKTISKKRILYANVITAIDSSYITHYNVAKITTLGKIVSVVIDRYGRTTEIDVSFDPKDEHYTLPFICLNGGQYYLNGNPALKCTLLIYGRNKKGTVYGSTDAKGWPNQ